MKAINKIKNKIKVMVMCKLTLVDWFTKKEIAERNAEKSGKSYEYHGDFPLQDALSRAERVYQEFVCKK